MPKSKRSKVISLTKTDKKTREWKETLFSKIRESVDKYDYVRLLESSHVNNLGRSGYLVSRTCETHF